MPVKETLTLLVDELAVPKVAVPGPLTCVHVPVPMLGALAAIVALVPQRFWSGPALARVGFWLKVMVTSSVEAVQGELLTVQRSVYDVPALPEKVEVGLLALPKLPPVPLTTLHIPVPIVGTLPARVTWVWPQVAALVWSGPALAVVGTAEALCNSCTPMSTIVPNGRAFPKRSVAGAPVFVPRFKMGEQAVM